MVQIDMDIPNSCEECRLYCREDGLSLCFAVSENGKLVRNSTVRQQWCPLIEMHEPCANCPLDPVRPVWKENKIYCGACGKRIPRKINAHYCHKCGRGINWL